MLAAMVMASPVTLVCSASSPELALPPDLKLSPGDFAALNVVGDATPTNLVAAAFARDPVRIKTFSIVDLRQVQVKGPPPDVYTAVLVRTDRGERIVLLKQKAVWWGCVLRVP